jgi:hypothetical protein
VESYLRVTCDQTTRKFLYARAAQQCERHCKCLGPLSHRQRNVLPISGGCPELYGSTVQSGILQVWGFVPGLHRLFIEYGVDNFVNGSAPLILDYFIIQNQTIPPFTPSPPTHAQLSTGAIAGVVIGSFLSLALIIFGLIPL